jgi:hypothetical protein
MNDDEAESEAGTMESTASTSEKHWRKQRILLRFVVAPNCS